MKKYKKKVLITGKFNFLHYGHFQLLEFAKNLNYDLYIGLINESKEGVTTSNLIRKKNLENLGFIKKIFFYDDLEELFIKIKPDIILKGSEHKDKKNEEEKLIAKFGGSIYFASGSTLKTSFKNTRSNFNKNFNKENINKYLDSHSISLDKLKKIIDNFKKFKVLIIGDSIIDKYVYCRTTGMSQEDKNLISSQILAPQIEIGGAAFVAKSFGKICGETNFITVLGEGNCELVKNSIKENSIKSHYIMDYSRKNTLKTRFLNDNNVVFRINEFDNHNINNEICEKIEKIIDENSKNFDALVFADYNYGCINMSSINKIIKRYKNEKFIAADCQISSQLGNIKKFENIDLITPTEHELRSSYSDNNSSILTLIDNFLRNNNIKNLVITLGIDGILIPKIYKDETHLHSLDALNKNPLNVSGAGDVFLTFSTLSLLQKECNIFEASLIASIASALKISYMEKKPVETEDVKNIIDGLY